MVPQVSPPNKLGSRASAWETTSHGPSSPSIISTIFPESEVVSHADALDPSLFGGETWGTMEISDYPFGGGELVDTIDDFHGAWGVFGKIFDVIDHFGGEGNVVDLIEVFSAGRPIE